jgi:DNA polymerase-3 subunit alpha
MNQIPFVGLHIHSDFSFLDGASQLSQMVDRVAELGMEAIALTDHGVMHGAIELIKLCSKKGIKPIIGNEMYVINGDIEDKTVKCRKYHQVVIALNKRGYQNLVKLTTISHLKGFMGKGIFARPCINKPLLEQYSEGLLVTSACLGGEIPQAILAGKLEYAYEVARWYKRVFGDRFYLEIQDHGQTEERIVNPALVQMSKDLGIELVATNDSHFISCYDVEAHDALLCIQTGKLVSDEKRMRYTGTEYLKTGEEMMLLFRDHLEREVVEKAIANTVAIADRVTDNYDLFAEPTEPTFPLPKGETPESHMRQWAEEGLKERLKKVDSSLHEKYWKQLNYEIDVLSRKGLCQYFLIVGDAIRWARSKGIPVGPGRGSAAGSIVSYAMRITNIDPIHHGLLFSRFINEERKSYPDIDTDFCVKRRGEVIQYFVEKYGSDRVAQIVTFNRLTSKAVIKDSGRVLNFPYKEVESYTKEIPVVRGKPAKLSLMISDESPVVEFKRRYEKDANFADLINLSRRLEGVNKTSGVHAAGVVISAKPLDEIVPLMVAKDGVVVTQYPMEDLEDLGLIKMDILGLRNLTTIDRTCRLVEKTKGINLNPEEFPMNDAKVFKFYQTGMMDGIFQMESSGMRSTIREISPVCIDDISSVLALYRPGPLDNGFIPKFIAGKNRGEIEPYVDHRLEPILSYTYGQMVYQEQIMKISQELAGYSLGEADLMRRAIGKKKQSEMDKQRNKFISGCVKNGILESVAIALFEAIEKFAEYCFNKSHSDCYSYVSYQTAYLKTHHPVEFLAALLTDDEGSKDKLQKHLAGVNQMKVGILPPDVNKSDMEFTPDGENIRFGLSAIANVGDGIIESILQARAEKPFDSFQDFCYRVRQLNSKLNKKGVESLIYSGAFDSIHPNRAELINSMDSVLGWASSLTKGREQDESSGQLSLFEAFGAEEPKITLAVPPLKYAPDFPLDEKLQLEKQFLQFYASGHPLQNAKKIADVYSTTPISEITEKEEIEGVEYWAHSSDKLVRVVALLSEVKSIVTKKGKAMAIIDAMEDLSGSCKGVVFPDTFESIKGLIQVGQRLLLWGKLGVNNEERQIVVDHAVSLSDARMLLLNLTPQQAQGRQLAILETILRPYQQTGVFTTPVVSQLFGKYIRFHPKFWVTRPEEVLLELRKEGFDAHVVDLSGEKESERSLSNLLAA